MSDPRATVGIISIGDMGVGIARLLIANDYKVITSASDRSEVTQNRARNSTIELMPSDEEFVAQADYILSIVPPRDAVATAQRIVVAYLNCQDSRRNQPLFYLDLNAISPRASREIHNILSHRTNLTYLDGGIIGHPPKPNPENQTWSRPSVPTSGPVPLTHAARSGAHLTSTLNIRHISSTIGAASGLKMCFASLAKGFTALALQSYTTAYNLDILPELQAELAERNPGALTQAERSLPGMPPKAYRWVGEMKEIGATFREDGGFGAGEGVFEQIAGVYGFVADGTVLGEEKTEDRREGKTAVEVARLVAEGASRRKEKTE